MTAFLAFETLVWLPYGLYLVFAPTFLANATEGGVVMQNGAGITEIRAMYGGLQAALGTLCLLALLRDRYAQPALIAVAFLTTGLFVARLYGVSVDGGLSGYTTGALVFEGASASIAFFLVSRRA